MAHHGAVDHSRAVNALVSASASYCADNSAVTDATGGMTVDELGLRDGEWSVSREGIRLGSKKVLHKLS